MSKREKMRSVSGKRKRVVRKRVGEIIIPPERLVAQMTNDMRNLIILYRRQDVSYSTRVHTLLLHEEGEDNDEINNKRR